MEAIQIDPGEGWTVSKSFRFLEEFALP